jgi:cytochrome c oxidase subunit II
MNKARLARLLGGLTGLGLALAATVASAYTDTSHGYNLPTGVTSIAREVYDLHMQVFWICVVIGIVVFGAMFYSVIKHRRSVHPKPADFHESTTIEIAWTVVPFLILIWMAVPAAGTLIRMEDSRNSEMSVKITGYQWKWHYEYMGQNVAFYSTLSVESNRARQLGATPDYTKLPPNYLVDVDKPLVLPVGRKIRFLLTANDVIHAWWVPELSVKKDAIPGYVNEMWAKIDTPGVYRGVCAELCGRDHGFMPIVVKAVPAAEFDAWLAGQKGGTELASTAPVALQPVAGQAKPDTTSAALTPTPESKPAIEVAAAPAAAAPAAAMSRDDLVKKGKDVYATNCAACHQADGTGLPPNFPTLHGSKTVNGPAGEHVKQILGGKGLMPPFKQLSDADIAAVATYERTSWGNKGGEVQPADVAKQR